MELRGKRVICEHVERAWKTVLALREKEDFPMNFIGGRWVSDTDEIKAWRVKQLRRR